jgi:hypothetical protein
VGIKEVVFGEQWVADLLWVAIEGATGSQRFDFLWVGRHSNKDVNSITPHNGSIDWAWQEKNTD